MAANADLCSALCFMALRVGKVKEKGVFYQLIHLPPSLVSPQDGQLGVQTAFMHRLALCCCSSNQARFEMSIHGRLLWTEQHFTKYTNLIFNFLYQHEKTQVFIYLLSSVQNDYATILAFNFLLVVRDILSLCPLSFHLYFRL